MVEFTNLTGAIGFEALFQATRADPRLIAGNGDRRAFAATPMQVFILPMSAIGLLQIRQPVGFPVAVKAPPTNGVPHRSWGVPVP